MSDTILLKKEKQILESTSFLRMTMAECVHVRRVCVPVEVLSLQKSAIMSSRTREHQNLGNLES